MNWKNVDEKINQWLLVKRALWGEQNLRENRYTSVRQIEPFMLELLETAYREGLYSRKTNKIDVSSAILCRLKFLNRT